MSIFLLLVTQYVAIAIGLFIVRLVIREPFWLALRDSALWVPMGFVSLWELIQLWRAEFKMLEQWLLDMPPEDRDRWIRTLMRGKVDKRTKTG